MKKVIAAFVAAALLTPVAAYADAAFDKAAARIKASFEQDKRMPLEPELYVDNLFVSHNYEPGKTVDTVAFLKGVGKELEAAKKVGISQKSEMTRFLKDGDTVVTTVLNTGTSADGKPSRFYIAYFFTIKDGKVAHIETWYDRKGSDDQLQSLSKEMKK
jgi:hypothetical protein